MSNGLMRHLKGAFAKNRNTAYSRGLFRGEALLAASQYERRNPMKEFSDAMADVRPVSWACDVAHDILSKPDAELFRAISVKRGKGGKASEYAISEGGWTLTVSSKKGVSAAYITDPRGREVSLAARAKSRLDGDERLLAAALQLAERYEEGKL